MTAPDRNAPRAALKPGAASGANPGRGRAEAGAAGASAAKHSFAPAGAGAKPGLSECAPAPPAADPASPAPQPALVEIGRVAGPHGLRGALRARLYNPQSTTLALLRRLLIGAAPGTLAEHRIEAAAPLGHGDWRLVLAGIGDVAAATALRGRRLFVEAGALPPAGPPGCYYYYQVLGATAFLTNGEPLGTVADIFPTKANDVWVIRQGSRQFFVPAIAEVITSIDLAARRVTIASLPGLLD